LESKLKERTKEEIVKEVLEKLGVQVKEDQEHINDKVAS